MSGRDGLGVGDGSAAWQGRGSPHGRTIERVGSSQWRVTGNDQSIMVVVSEDSTVGGTLLGEA